MSDQPVLYDRIGTEYDTTRRADPYLADRLAHHLRLGGGRSYLDVACGTGNYTAALAARGGRWFGVDLSARMLGRARGKAGTVAWTRADVTRLPYPAAVFDAALCTLAIHHFPDLAAAFGEVRRVLRPRGRFVLFTSTWEQTGRYWLAEYFPAAIRRSAEQMPSLEAVTAALAAAGFRAPETEPYEVREDLADRFLYSGKHRPEIYLDPAIRRGISTFSTLADPEEVEDGLARLAADLASGRIDAVRRSFRHDAGDYLFVAARAQKV